MKISRRVYPIGLAVSLLVLGPGLRPAASQLLGPEFQVNSYTAGGQRFPAVAADSAGNFLVVWQSDLQDGSSYGVFGRRFDSAGSPVGSDFQVNNTTTNSQRDPAVAADGLGNFIVAWESLGQDGSNNGVFGRRFSSAGPPVGNEFLVNSSTLWDQQDAAVAADGTGRFVVVWTSSDGPSMGVFGQRFDSTGGLLGSEFRVNSYTTLNQGPPAVAMDLAGDFVVVWMSQGQDGSGYGVFGQRFSSAGNPVGSEFQVNSYTTGDQRYPAVDADSAGNFVVIWDGIDQDGSVHGIFGKRFSSAGSAVGTEFQVNTFTTNQQLNPAVAMDDAGNFVAAWTSDDQDGHGTGVIGKRFNSAGTPVGSEFQINSYTTLFQTEPAVAADGAGNFVVAWRSSHAQDGSSDGVFGKQLTIAVFSDGFELDDACAWSAAVGGGCP